MSVSHAIRYVPATKAALGILYINCHVKPNARQGAGILSVDGEMVELAVYAQARKGEANKAVVELLASVLQVPKSDVEVVRGLKSREKTVKIDSSSTWKEKSKFDTAEEAKMMVCRVQELLERGRGEVKQASRSSAL